MNPKAILSNAMAALDERGQTYDRIGSVEENFTRAASIASLWLDRPVSAREVALILASVKISRIASAPGHLDSFIDLVNYVSFGAAFSFPAEHDDDSFADAIENALAELNGHGA